MQAIERKANSIQPLAIAGFSTYGLIEVFPQASDGERSAPSVRARRQAFLTGRASLIPSAACDLPETLRTMTQRIFTSPQDCESAFYEALEKADLEAMMAVWAEDEEIICIHPGGPRLVGHAAVREIWRQVFQAGARLSVHVGQIQAMQSMMMATHCVHEFIALKGEARPLAPVIATNVYVRSGNGWKMLLHHSSSSPKVEQAATQSTAAARPKVLH